METPRGPQKPLACRRAQSLDRPQAPRKDSGSGQCNCRCLSFSTTPCRRPLRRTSSDGARHSGIPAQSAEAQGTVTIALTLEEMRGLHPSEQRPQQDAKKDKAQRRAQQGWLKAVLNFFLRTGPEEPREKASKRPKGKEESTEPPDGPGEPALRTRARDKKASRKKHSHRKHDAEDPEAGLPRTEAASAEEADLGPAGKGERTPLPSDPCSTPGTLGLNVTHTWREMVLCLFFFLMGRRASREIPNYPIRGGQLRGTPGWRWPLGRFQILGLSSQMAATGPPVQPILCCFLKWIQKVTGTSPTCPLPRSRPPAFISIPGGHDSYLHPSLPIEVGGAGFSDVSPQAAGPQPEEHLRKLDQDAVIQRIVELLKKVGDQWEEEQQLQVPQPEVVPQNPSPICKRKSQERKSSLKRAFSLKKYGPGPEESRRAGAADVPSAEARPPKKSSFLPMCVIGSHRSSVSSSPGLEEPEVHEALSADGEGPSPSEPPTHARCQGPVEELPLDGASESSQYPAPFHRDPSGKCWSDSFTCRRETEAERGSVLPRLPMRAASGPRAQAWTRLLLRALLSIPTIHSCNEDTHLLLLVQASNPDIGRPRFSHLSNGAGCGDRGGSTGQRPFYFSGANKAPSRQCWFKERLSLPVITHLCAMIMYYLYWGTVAAAFDCGDRGVSPHAVPHRPFLSLEEGIICTLVELLQEVDGELGDQIGRHPSFKRFFYEFSDSTLRKLVTTLRRRKTHSPGGARSLAQRPSPYVFGLVHKFAGSHSRTICSLMGSRGHCVQHNFTQFPSREAQPNMPSPECQSPD
ncbi:protein BNIP5 [Marmota marmota marmota]|uniref:protein BNIP5 n=1 Tax=Marmota marmota marmota TaxID=9994 RepID=UPI002092DB8E|nr:protein BNIP5 [Marmota marmota marmota]